MSNNKRAIEREEAIKNRAQSVMAMTTDAVDLTAPAKQQMEQLQVAVQKNPLFESVGVPFGVTVSGAWTEALCNFKSKHGHYPSPEILANAYHSLETLMTECAQTESSFKGPQKAMLESAAADMRTSEGVMKQAIFAAMILPAALGAATSDACTFVPCERDIAKVYELTNIAGSNFGDFKQGDELNMHRTGQYSQMRRTAKFDEDNQPDGEKKAFTFTLAKSAGVEAQIIKGRVKVLVNRRVSKKDDGESNVYFTGTDFKGVFYQATGKIDYSKGVIVLTFQDAPAKGTELAAQIEINVENQPELIPVINQTMKEYEVSPSQYILASEHTVMSASGLQREFGLNLQSIQFQAMTQWLAHETDMARLRTLVFHTVPDYSREFDVALPEGQTYESWVGILSHAVNRLSTEMLNRNKKSGIRGGFAGGDAANYLRSLPSSVFQKDPNYVQSPYVQYIGTLFNTIRIYEVPNPACESFQAEGIEFMNNDIYFYGRGNDIGQAGLIAGDAVPAMPFVHPTDPKLVNRTTLWGSALNEIHPREGESYFTRLRLTNSKVGAFDMLTGLPIVGDAGK
ncbi:capsid protein [Rosenbergiella collisarenosi]|uniref:capsid protein n=1 Tax=Rosenbergiella collisarenosi TaxID=1544695 RepID=UPI001F4D9283|nr:capsid protein [Rosenbergiella collisarenosi]